MIALTRREIKKACKKERSPVFTLLCLIWGLALLALPLATVYLGFVLFQSDVLLGLLVLTILPIAIIFPMLLILFCFSPIKNLFATWFMRYRIVRAKCTGSTYIGIETDTGEPHGKKFIFSADDGTTITSFSGVPEGQYAYIIVVGGDVLAVFDAAHYYAENYESSFSKKGVPKKKTTTSGLYGRLILEYLLYVAIAMNVFGILLKTWLIALGGSLIMVFYVLGSLLGQVHAKATGIISLVYLFASGVLIIFLSRMYSPSTGAYIVGAVFIFLSLLITYIWDHINSKKQNAQKE